jgi:hypothetical protein
MNRSARPLIVGCFAAQMSLDAGVPGLAGDESQLNAQKPGVLSRCWPGTGPRYRGWHYVLLWDTFP